MKKNWRKYVRYDEVMVEPREPPTFPKPHISDIGQAQQVFLANTNKVKMNADIFSQTFSPPSPSSCPAESNYASPLLPDGFRSSFVSGASTLTVRIGSACEEEEEEVAKV